MVTLSGNESVTFRVFAPQAANVQLLGSFTAWDEAPISMVRDDEGWHAVTVSLRSGDYEFQYLMDGSVWLADYAAGGVRMNEFGTWVSQLHVPEVVSRAARASGAQHMTA